MSKNINYTEQAREELARTASVLKVGPSDNIVPILGVDDATVTARLEKAFAGHTTEEIANLSWTDKVLLAQGKEIVWPSIGRASKGIVAEKNYTALAEAYIAKHGQGKIEER